MTARATAAAVLLAALTVGTWWLWLGSDTVYQVDSQTGVASGPYAAPQIVACVLCLAVLTVAGALLLPGWLAVAAMVIALVATWSARASADTTGMWGVGAFMLTIGMTAGTALVVAVTQRIRRVLAGRRGP